MVLKCHSSFLLLVIAVIVVVVAVVDVVVDDVGAGSSAIHAREDGAAFGRDPQAHGSGGKVQRLHQPAEPQSLPESEILVNSVFG